MADWVLLGIALAAGFVLGLLVILPLRLRRRGADRDAARTTAPKPRRDEVVPLEIVSDDEPPTPAAAAPATSVFSPLARPAAPERPPTDGSEWDRDHFSIAKKPEG